MGYIAWLKSYAAAQSDPNAFWMDAALRHRLG
jgi:hypothetical protein